MRQERSGGQAMLFYQGQQFYNRERFKEALEMFLAVYGPEDKGYGNKAFFEICKCYDKLEQYAEGLEFIQDHHLYGKSDIDRMDKWKTKFRETPNSKSYQ